MTGVSWLLASLLTGFSCTSTAAVGPGETLSPVPVSGQDGKLVCQVALRLDDETLTALREMTKSLPFLEEMVKEIPEKIEKLDVTRISYSSGGLTIGGFLIEPVAGGKYPCLIVNRGGNRKFGGWTREEVFLLLSEIASWGYVVVASQYRGGPDSEGNDELGGADVDDVLALVPLLESREKVDTSRMGMLGMSRGGMMTYIALTRTQKVKAAAVVGGVTDLLAWEQARPEMTEVFRDLIGEGGERAEALASRSAVRWAGQLPKQTQLLILHGAADERVPAFQPLALASELLKTSQPFRLVMFEGGDHNLTRFWPEWLEIVRAWFRRHL